jgi:tRNA-modifying protein YgfZ
MTQIALLPDRGVIELAGEDRASFLQGLVSNDVTLAAPGRAVWTALLTPQGKWLADFFIFADGERLLLEVERAQVEMLVQRLGRFRLRSKISLADRSDAWRVYAAWSGEPSVPAGAVAAPDPRLPAAGWRIVAPDAMETTASAQAWDAHRIALGLPDGSRDLEPEKSVLLEAGFDELHGVSWTKGCYMGQELTARTKYRGLVKRRLVPVAVDGPLPPSGTPITRGGTEVGAMRSGCGAAGIAQLRLDAIGADALQCGDALLRPRVPGWMVLPEPAA